MQGITDEANKEKGGDMRIDLVKLMKWSGLVLVTLVCAMPGVSDAKTLYVNGATGNDAITYAGNDANNPWLTIGRAAWGSANRTSPSPSQAAQAGDIVLIAAGTYTVAGTNTRYAPAYNPVNSGRAGAYIVFRGVGRVELRLSSGLGPVIGSHNSRHYIEWDNFYIDEANARTTADTGPVTVMGSNNVILRNLEIRGVVPSWWPYTDNHNGIRLEDTVGSQVINNRIYGFKMSDGVDGINAAGIMTYTTTDAIIEHNDISDCGVGVYLKNAWGPVGENITVRLNYLHRNKRGVKVSETNNSRIYQNIIADGVAQDGQAVAIEFGGDRGITNITVVNNTVHNVRSGWWIYSEGPGWSNNRIQNNIFTNTTSPIDFADGAVYSQNVTIDRNNYYNLVNFVVAGRGYSTLSSWVSATPGDRNSRDTNPLYVDAARNNFLLSNGSSARTIGVDILDLNRNGSTVDVIPAGAYITGLEVIGRHSGSSDSVPPMAPTNLQIR